MASAGPQQTAKAKPQAPRVLRTALTTMVERYIAATPTAAAVIDRVYRQGYGEDQIVHDHFAFRSFGVTGQGIEALGGALEAFGWSCQDYYTFPKTHLLAAWYAPPRGMYDVLPRMFISQLQVNKLSLAAQDIIHSYTDELASSVSGIGGASSGGVGGGGGGGGVSRPSLAAWTSALTRALPWRCPSRDDYEALLQESEYAAWVLVNGWSLNHTALSTHSIKGRTADIFAFANDLVMQGFNLNDQGGIMKVSPDSGLLQCSTVADVRDFTFADGQVLPVVGAYMEFVERKPQPEHEHLAATGQLLEEHRRNGFEAESAGNIFASTTLAAEALSSSRRDA